MRISVITATYNSASTIRDTIESVLNQNYPNVEFIVVDGASTDNTLEIVKEYGTKITKVFSEPDGGIYDAMNKGIRNATGDVVGILNSDDFFSSSDILQTICETFSHNNIDALYGDVHYVDPTDLTKIRRYYSSKIFKPSLFRFGFMPAHPSFYMKKSCYDVHGLYPLDYQIAADYDFLIRYIYKYRIKTQYVKKDFVTMRVGGKSTESIQNRLLLNKEIVKACKRYGIKTNLFIVSLRYFYKIFEFRR